MAKFSPLTFILLAFAVVQSNATQNHPSPPTSAPAPKMPPSCDVLMFTMIDCLPYLTKGSQMAKPLDSCCSGFLEVWKLDSNCVCEAINGSAVLGFQLNMTRVVHFSSACSFQHVSLDKCSPIPSEARPPVEIIKPSPATPSAHAMTTCDAVSNSLLSNFFTIVISVVVIIVFLASS